MHALIEVGCQLATFMERALEAEFRLGEIGFDAVDPITYIPALFRLVYAFFLFITLCLVANTPTINFTLTMPALARLLLLLDNRGIFFAPRAS